MAALAGLVPPLLFSVALVAGLHRGSRRQRPAADAPVPVSGPESATLPVQPASTVGDEPVRAGTEADGPTVELGCRACGWTLDRPGWLDGRPTSAICDCCACEAGIDDVTPERALTYRRRWVEHGAEWFDPESRPDSWDLYAHLCELAPV